MTELSRGTLKSSAGFLRASCDGYIIDPRAFFFEELMASFTSASAELSLGAPAALPLAALDPPQMLIGLLMAPDQFGRWYSPIAGKTRLQKEAFLLTKETGAGRAGTFRVIFRPDSYGPFAPDLAEALDKLLSTHLVRQSGAGPSQEYSLTDEGRNAAIHLWKEKFTQQVREAFYAVKSNYNEWNLTNLLSYVYSTYPALTTRSSIRDEVLR